MAAPSYTTHTTTSDTEKNDQENFEPLDGGMQAWMTVAGSWMIQFCTLGYISAFGVYQDYYTREFLSQKSPSEISWIGSFQLFMQYAPGILVGRAFDSGYFHYMIAAGSFIQVVCTFMLSLSHHGQYYQVFLSQAVGIGLGQSLLFLPSLSIIGHHFKRRRAFATGIAVTGASCGGIVWPVMLNQLGQQRTRSAHVGGDIRIVKDILTDGAFMVSVIGACFVCLGFFFPYFYLQLYSIDKGINPNWAFYTLAILNAGSVLGRLLPNFFADHIGPYNMIIPCIAFTSFLLFALLGSDIKDVAGIVAFALAYGFFSGSYYSLIPSLISLLAKNISELGTRMGVAFSCVGLFMLFGSPIDGALLRTDNSDSYAWSRCIAFCGAMVLCGAATMILSRVLFVHDGRHKAMGREGCSLLHIVRGTDIPRI
ncbi:major facilitator superfamily domain-containing protein [Armillaria mellea]|nr:major facilitator superfamily domain-containing protein [Armillaria mellea]